MKRYWIRLKNSERNLPPATNLGIGVTGYDYEDVLNQIKDRIFISDEIPPILECIENIDVELLDSHVRPNMGITSRRGIWFPLGYED